MILKLDHHQFRSSAQLFAWEAYERDVDVHLLTEPTKLEMLQKEYDSKKDQFKSQVQKNILEKYGGEEHLHILPKSLLLAQTEDYVEYSRSGNVLKGQEKEIICSRYEEDIYINNLTNAWGFYWSSGHWGYKCCHSFIKNSYCLREAILKAKKSTETATLTSEDIHENSKAIHSNANSSSSSDSEETNAKKKQK